jgi:hypothetical protein
MTSESPRTFLRSAPIISPRLRHTCRRSCVHPHQSGVHTNFHLPTSRTFLRSAPIISPRLRHTCRRSCVHPHQSGVHTNFHLPPPLASLRSFSGPTISLQSTAATLPKSKNNGFARNQPACWLEQQTSSSRNSSCLDCGLQRTKSRCRFS